MSMLAAAAISAGASALGSRRQAKGAEDSANQASEAQAAAMNKGISYLDALQPAIDNFAQIGQDGFDKYQRMMGPLEDSLNDYYSNLNPDDLAAQGNQSAQQQYQNTMNQVNDQLASQGIMNSGLEAQMGMQYGNQMAQTKAQNIMDAPGQVANQQQQWLGYTSDQSNNSFNQMQSGLNAQTNQANQYNAAYQNMANMYGGQSQQANQNAQNSYNQQNKAIGTMGEVFGYM